MFPTHLHKARTMRSLCLAVLLSLGCAGLGVAQDSPAPEPADSSQADSSPAAADQDAADQGAQLRWKFNTDQNLKVVMSQEMTQDMKVAETTVSSSTTNKTWSKWHTTEVHPDGSATILSEVTRILMTIENPVTGKMVLDTDQPAEEEGQAAQLEAMLRPMVGAEIRNRMSPRGKVSDVKIPDEALAGLQGAVGGGMMSAEKLGEMMQKVSPVFPEQAMQEGDSWTSGSEVKTPVGNMKVDSTYTYEGPVEVDGRPLHSIRVDMTMDFEAPEGGPSIKFGDQKSTGVMLFDNQAGRLVRSDIEQVFTLKVEAAPGQVLEQKITQKTSNVVEEL